MRILLTTHQFLPEYFSGTEILAYTTAKELQRRGQDVVVFTGAPSIAGAAEIGLFDSYVYDGLPVETKGASWSARGAKPLWKGWIASGR